MTNARTWALAHSRSILFLIAVLTLGGAFTGTQLPVGLFPDLVFPRLRASVEAGDRPAERMATEVTYNVEVALRSIPGARHIRSTTSRGSAEVSVSFDWGIDMSTAVLQAESALNRIAPTLPAGTAFDVSRMDPTVFPVIAYSLTSDTLSLAELQDLALYNLRPILTALNGVASIKVQGGATQEYQVLTDPARLQALGLTIDDIVSAISVSNVISAVGRFEEDNKLYLVIADSQFKQLSEIGETILRSGDNGVVRLEDVATVIDAAAPNFTRVTADGQDAVILQIYQQPGGNTVQIAKDVKQALADREKSLPPGVRIANWYDQSELIVASASSVRDAVIIGSILAALVLFVFLRNWRVAIVAVFAVPVVLATTVLMLRVFGMSFNIMTLGGMAAAVGLIIDDAIVMVEHIVRRAVSKKDPHAIVPSGILLATKEITPPLIASSLATTIIFVPLAFLTGVTGAFFKALSLTMATSLIISFLLAWLAVPILVGIVFHKAKEGDADDSEEESQTGWIDRTYRAIMRPLLRAPILVLVLLVPLLFAGWLGYKNVGSGFMPKMDEGGFILDYTAPPGTSLTETDRLLRQVEDILHHVPEVDTYSRRTGLQLGGGLSESNVGDFFIRLKPLPRRGIEPIMDDVRAQVAAQVPGLEIETALLMEDLIGDLTAVPQPIEIKLFGDREDQLMALAPKIAEAIGKVNGVVEVKDGIIYAGDAVIIEVDDIKAIREGFAPDLVHTSIADLVEGKVTTNIQDGPKLIDVRVWSPSDYRKNLEDIRDLLIRAPDGHSVPLDRIATLKKLTGQPEIEREDLKRMIPVTARISGRDLGSTIADVKKVLDQPGTIPASSGVYYKLGGLYEQQRIAFLGMRNVIIAAITLVFLLLLFVYERFLIAIAMLATPLLAMPAVLFGLWITGTELNITATMGMTMVVGIVGEVAIFYVSEYRSLTSGDEPLIQAALNRLRPIAMTTFAAILALLPLALGIGAGSAMQQPLAIAIISGLIAQLPLSLIVLPCFLKLFRVSPTAPESA